MQMPSSSVTINSNSENQEPRNHHGHLTPRRTRMADGDANTHKSPVNTEIVTDDAILDLIHHQNKSMDTSTCTPMSFRSEINHFNVSPKLRRNPRDAKSPKRNRTVTKRKDSQYDPPAPILSPARTTASVTTVSIGNMNAKMGNENGNVSVHSPSHIPMTMDALSAGENIGSSVQSYGDGGGGVSIQSQSDIRSSASSNGTGRRSHGIGGLQYIEGASVTSQSRSTTRPNRSRNPNHHSRSTTNRKQPKYPNKNGTSTAGPSPYHQQGPSPYQHHPSSQNPNARRGSSSVSSRSSTGTGAASRSTRSINSQSYHHNRANVSLLIAQQEQELFEKRLCDASYGVAVRKIHSNGKSQLRHVKCIMLSQEESGSTSGMKLGGGSRMRHNMSASVPDANMNMYASHSKVSNHRQKNNYSSSKSVTSLRSRISRRRNRSSSASASHHASASLPHPNANITVNTTSDDTQTSIATEKQLQKQSMALTWGNKKKVVIPLCKFTAVRKGKTTNRTMRNPCDPSLLLSLVTGPGTGRMKGKRQGCINLDIEAPTKLDRDKFAKAFSVFLDVPLEDDFVGEDVKVNMGMAQDHDDDGFSLQSTSTASSVMTPHGLVEYQIGNTGALLPSLNSSPSSKASSKQIINETPRRLMMDAHDFIDKEQGHGLGSGNGIENFSLDGEGSLHDLLPVMDSHDDEESDTKEQKEKKNASDVKTGTDENKDFKKDNAEDDARSAVSSLTQGFDQEIVEELHQALNELRAELESSRAEAARAVKVAEQAIQSAESCSSNDWNSTVTHKAAEAAALAQKRSAEAISKQGIAQEKLSAERKSATFWRRQAQKVEDEAAAMQTRLAVAQVQRAAITEELDREKRKATSYIQTMKRDYSMQESIQRESISMSAEQNRLLEIELDGTRRDLVTKSEDAKSLQDAISDLKNDLQNNTRIANKKKFFGKSKKPRGPSLLESELFNSTTNDGESSKNGHMGSLHIEELLKIQSEASAMKTQFEMLRRTTADELQQLPKQAKEWSSKASKAVNAAQIEVSMLKNQLALEVSNRRKLLNEVQDLRGTVRVYCLPRSPSIVTDANSTPSSIISSPSHDIALLHKDWINEDMKGKPPMCFEFDRMFTAGVSQSEVYSEMEELVLGCLEGFNACLMAYGQSGSGKTHSMIGDFKMSSGDGFGDDAMPLIDLVGCGIHLLAARQLFEVSHERKGRFEDSFTLSILEIQDEKLVDLVADTAISEKNGVVKNVDGRDRKVSNKVKNTGESAGVDETSTKLEIRANHDGDTIVQGQISVPVASFEDVVDAWKESLAMRAKKLMDAGANIQDHDSNSHMIATIEVMSTNINTGIGTIGKLQCADLGASNAIQKRGSSSSRSKATGMDNILAPVGNKHEWKFLNKSLSTFADVVDARVNFSRNVPYRNSTLTHVLRDTLEADTKTMLLVCVKSDSENLQDTANSLRLASKMRKVVIGKATKHHISVA